MIERERAHKTLHEGQGSVFVRELSNALLSLRGIDIWRRTFEGSGTLLSIKPGLWSDATLGVDSSAGAIGPIFNGQRLAHIR